MPSKTAIFSLVVAALAGTTANAQQAQESMPQTQSVLVTLEGKLDKARLDRLKEQLGVAVTEAVPSLNGEVWEVPNDKLSSVFQSIRKPEIAAVDYSGSDFRTLFLPISGADLGPAQSQAIQAISATPTLQDVQIVRLRAGDITSRLLTKGLGPAEGLPEAGSLVLNLRPDKSVLITRKTIDLTTSREFEWTGISAPLADVPLTVVPSSGEVSLIVNGNRVLGSVDVGTETYSIIPLSGGLHAIAKVNKDAFPPEHPAIPETPMEQPAARDPNGADAPVAASQTYPEQPLKIGVAYTQAALEALHAARPSVTMDDYAKLAILKTNSGFASSNIKGTVELAGVTLIDGDEPGDFDSLVDALVAPSDRQFDAIHKWRRKSGADTVLVLVAIDTYCGMAAGIHVDEPHAFATVNWNCAVDNLSFPHEFGHLLGARHDPDTDPDDHPYPYAHGYRYKNTWRTIMAYAGGECRTCPRINRWANPNQTLDGVALGTPERNHDARLIEEMLPIYARLLP